MVKKEEKKEKIVFVTGKRKRAVARAKITFGTGKILINYTPLEIWGNEILRLWIKEPLILSEMEKGIDANINVRSGGVVGQAEAIRQAIARGIVELTKSEEIKEKFMKYDRNLLAYDFRRTEPHHAGGASKRGARKHKQRYRPK